MNALGSFATLFSTEELAALYAHSIPGPSRVPSWRAAFGIDPSVDYAVDVIRKRQEGPTWLESVKSRLLPDAGYPAIASAMAELRCYGALLEAGYDVVPLPETDDPTPDFQIRGPNGAAFVEVASKQEDAAQTKITELIANGKTPEGVERSRIDRKHGHIESTVREQYPFGAPDTNKPGDSTQANAISRLCSVKNKEHQARESTSLLWIDLRDLGSWPDLISPDQCEPLILGRGGALTAGCVWYAHYGWKGAPIFEANIGGGEERVGMGHHGRFSDPSKPSKYAGVIMNFMKTAVLLENPHAGAPLTDDLRMRLHALPDFDLMRSVASWTQGGANRSIDENRRMIEAFTAHKRVPQTDW